eukprot:169770-Chlamydomonas_euryale.AAC.2
MGKAREVIREKREAIWTRGQNALASPHRKSQAKQDRLNVEENVGMCARQVRRLIDAGMCARDAGMHARDADVADRHAEPSELRT